MWPVNASNLELLARTGALASVAIVLAASFFIFASVLVLSRCAFLRALGEYAVYAYRLSSRAKNSGLLVTLRDIPTLLLNLATAWARPVPNVFIAGTMKGGTSSLHTWLCQHPAVTQGLSKETHYFDGRSIYGSSLFDAPAWIQRLALASFYPSWFASRFFGTTGFTHVLESTPMNLLFAPWVAPHAARLLGRDGVKVIILTRDPVERLKSHYKFGQSWEWPDEKMDAEQAIAAEPTRHAWNAIWKSCTASGHSGPAVEYGVTSLAHHSYVRRGKYVVGIQAWTRAVNPANVLVLSLDELSMEPQATMNRVFAFLNLQSVKIDPRVQNKTPKETKTARPGLSPAKQVQSKDAGRAVITHDTEMQLRSYFKPWNDKLYRLYKVTAALEWNRKTKAASKVARQLRFRRNAKFGVVVTGFKRSGTSLAMNLMRILGHEPFFDKDFETYLKKDYPAENPYFYEKKSCVHQGLDATSLSRVVELGSAVKVFCYGFNKGMIAAAQKGNLKVVLMRRNTNAIRSSISIYKSTPTPGHRTKEDDFNVLNKFDFDQLASSTGALMIDYDELVDQTASTLQTLCAYLGVNPNAALLARLHDAVNPKLRHHRAKSP